MSEAMLKPSMLTVEQLRDILKGVSYRPGWTFEIFEARFEGPYIRIIAPVENAYGGDPIVLGIDSPLPGFWDDRHFLDWLLWRLQRVESHESREWFRYKGELVSDPHEKD